RFMDVAVWLEDCGLYHLTVTGRLDGRQGPASDGVRVELEIPHLYITGAPPRVDVFGMICEDPSAVVGKSTWARFLIANRDRTYSVPLVSINRDDDIEIYGPSGPVKTSVAEIGNYLESSPDPTVFPGGRIHIRANRDVTYGRFIEVVDQLRRDG